MNINVTMKNVYGNDIIYPACETSRIFAQMAGQKTLTMRTIMLIKQLGYTVRVVSDIVEL